MWVGIVKELEYGRILLLKGSVLALKISIVSNFVPNFQDQADFLGFENPQSLLHIIFSRWKFYQVCIYGPTKIFNLKILYVIKIRSFNDLKICCYNKYIGHWIFKKWSLPFSSRIFQYLTSLTSPTHNERLWNFHLFQSEKMED